MKKLVFFLFVFGAQHLCAQTWNEWFAQKKTQLKYLAQQIATFQIYAGYLEKGYHIAQQGLTAINDIKNGEFSLHKNYFGSLSAVNPKVKNMAEVAEIIAMQVSVVQQFKKMVAKAKNSGQFNSGELGYFGNVYTGVVAACINDVDELIGLTTNGQLQMTDDERMKRVGVLYKDMQDKYAFTQSFANDASLLALQRQRDANEINLLKKLQ